MKVTVNENQMGLLFKDGRFVKLLKAGKYSTLFGKEIEVVSVDDEVSSAYCTLDTLLMDEEVRLEVSEVEVGDSDIVLHYVDGRLVGVLEAGRHAFWDRMGSHVFIKEDCSESRVSEDFPLTAFSKLKRSDYVCVSVPQYFKARLFTDGAFTQLLEPGTYYYWTRFHSVDWELSDTRLIKMDINGQEMLTADKVTLRVNFVVSYRIADHIRVASEISDLDDQIRTAAQLALREYVGKYKLDDILDHKEEMSADISAKLMSKAPELYIEISDAGVKDIIIPGEIRDIMNTVLIAEKTAQANVITRREEVASTRSLLNTAKLMDENETLYRLKEMEFVEKICENVGNITLSGTGNVLDQLMELTGKRRR